MRRGTLFSILVSAVIAAQLFHGYRQHQEVQELRAEQEQLSLQIISETLGKLQPRAPFSKNELLRLASSTDQIDDVSEFFSFNPNRSIEVIKKKELSSFWTQLSGAAEEVKDLTSKFLAAKIPTAIKQGTTASIEYDTDGSILSASWRLDEKSLVHIERYLGNTFSVRKISDTQTLKERVVSGTIASNFVNAALDAGLPYALIDDYVDLFSERVDFRKDLQPGDTFSIILDEHQGSDGRWLSSGTIKAACLFNEGKLLAVVRSKAKDGRWVSFDEKGNAVGSYFLRYPVQFTRISSVFAGARLHPVLGFKRPHQGVDFAAPTGTPVRSVADGVVVSAGYAGASGNMIKVSHGSRYATTYPHLSRIGKGIRKGSRVSRGQVIGAVGMTGLATGPHLHFGLYDSGRYVDPMRSKLPSVVSEKDLAPPQFIKATLARLQDEIHKVVVAKNIKDFSKQG